MKTYLEFIHTLRAYDLRYVFDDEAETYTVYNGDCRPVVTLAARDVRRNFDRGELITALTLAQIGGWGHEAPCDV